MGGVDLEKKNFNLQLFQPSPKGAGLLKNHVHQDHFLLDPKDPTLDPGNRPFRWIQFGFEEFRQSTLAIGETQPGGYRISIVLVRGAAFFGEISAPKSGIDLRHNRPSIWYIPAIEWPEMNPVAQFPSNDSAARAGRHE